VVISLLDHETVNEHQHMVPTVMHAKGPDPASVRPHRIGFDSWPRGPNKAGRRRKTGRLFQVADPSGRGGSVAEDGNIVTYMFLAGLVLVVLGIARRVSWMIALGASLSVGCAVGGCLAMSGRSF
jgi:hypothetical protein